MPKKRKNIKTAIAIISLVLISALILFNYNSKNEETICKDCNVILISIDTLRADHVGIYGYYRNTTPSIDNFASKSILFENAIAQASWTLPSHTSIFTSLYPPSHGVLGIEDSLAKNITTISKILKSNGYTTAAFIGGVQWFSPEYGLDKGFDTYDLINYSKTRLEGLKRSSIYFLDRTNPVYNWLSLNKNKKFFLFFHTYSVHDPYVTTNYYSRIFDTDYKGKMLDSEDELLNVTWDVWERNYSKKDLNKFLKEVVRPLLESRTNYSDQKDVNHLIAVYDGKILRTDGFVGLLLNTISDYGLLNNTIIIVSSDHGEEFGEHGKFGHAQQLYEETIHVPLIIYNPEIQKGIRVKTQAQLIDVVPTILDMLDIRVSKQFQGKSLLPTMLVQNSRDFNNYVFSFHGDMLSIRTNEWKLIFRVNGKHELYNLISDPNEKNNLAEMNNYKLIELKRKLLDWSNSIGIKQGAKISSKDLEDKLRQLGYIT